MTELVNGTRVLSSEFGLGTIVDANELANDAYPGRTPVMVPTGRHGVVFDTHTLTARPAYFYPREFKVNP